MANRLRILFRDLDGTVHSGNRAVQALYRRFVAGRTQLATEWVTEARIQDRPMLQARLEADEILYRVPTSKASEGVLSLPDFPNKVEKVKWLWKHLPKEVANATSIVVSRESRYMKWRKSQTNPSRIGWAFKLPRNPRRVVAVGLQKAAELPPEQWPDDLVIPVTASPAPEAPTPSLKKYTQFLRHASSPAKTTEPTKKKPVPKLGIWN